MSRASGRRRCGRCRRGWGSARCRCTGMYRTVMSCSTRWWSGSSTSSPTIRRSSCGRWTGGGLISLAWRTACAATPGRIRMLSRWSPPGRPTAPWVNPPLRSLRWVEAMLAGLAEEGFSDEQVLFTYRTFNSFLLGYLLLETSAMALRDPKPGDGSFTSTDTSLGRGRRVRRAGSRQPGHRRPEPGPLGSSSERHSRTPTGHASCSNPRTRLTPGASRRCTALRMGSPRTAGKGSSRPGLEDMLDRIAAFVAETGQARLSRNRGRRRPEIRPA